jgi:glycosyltransferase 2 family protein
MDTGMSRTGWAWARVLGGAAILAVVVWRLGTGPFVDGIRTVDRWALAAGAGIAVLTTVCCAARWRLVARGLGLDLPLHSAVAAYYRSQFLNTVLPGGVLGDVHRAARHGRDVDDLGRSFRAVAWERTAGQVVQVAVVAIVLLALPSPVRASMPVVLVALATTVLVVVLLARALPTGGTAWWERALRTAVADARDGLLARRSWPGVVLTSVLIVAGHTATFLIAARAAGSTASPTRLLPLVLLVLLATTLPINIGGWGPREGVAAWAFGVAGLGVDQGVATAVVYGVLVLVASLPGAVVLAVEWSQHGARVGGRRGRRVASGAALAQGRPTPGQPAPRAGAGMVRT